MGLLILTISESPPVSELVKVDAKTFVSKATVFPAHAEETLTEHVLQTTPSLCGLHTDNKESTNKQCLEHFNGNVYGSIRSPAA